MKTHLKHLALRAERALRDVEQAAVARHDPQTIELACIALLAARLLVDRVDELEASDIDLDEDDELAEVAV